MKKTIFMIAGLIAGTASAQDAEQLKEFALNACDTQMQQVPADQREKAMKICKCTVNNTDYAAVLENTKAGNTEQIQKDALAVAQKCTTENM